MGHLSRANEERGVVARWTAASRGRKCCTVDDGTARPDLVIHRTNPNTSTRRITRTPDAVAACPRRSRYGADRSDDGGAKWQKMTAGCRPATSAASASNHQKNPKHSLTPVVENVNRGTPDMGRRSTAAKWARADAAVAPLGATRAKGAGMPAIHSAPNTVTRRASVVVQQPQGRGRAARARESATRSFALTTAARRGGRRNGHDVDVAGGKARTPASMKIKPGQSGARVVTATRCTRRTDGGKSWGCTNSTGFFNRIFGDFRTILGGSRRIQTGSCSAATAASACPTTAAARR